MDRPLRESRRSSILKVRQTEASAENTPVEDDPKYTLKRRVSFHNVKTVQNFEKDDLNLLDGSPFREKIQETMSSDGILTPGKGRVTPTDPTSRGDMSQSSFMDNTLICFKEEGNHLCFREVTKYSVTDMSINETGLHQELCSPADMSICQTTSTESSASRRRCASRSDSTQYDSEDMSFSINSSSRSSDGTLLALEEGLGNGTKTPACKPISPGCSQSMMDVTRGDVTKNDTMACVNTQLGQNLWSLKTLCTSQNLSDKSSISFAEEDTALVFDVETVAPREIGKQDSEEISTVLSDSFDDGNTMAVFSLHQPDTGTAERDSSDVTILAATPNISLESSAMEASHVDWEESGIKELLSNHETRTAEVDSTFFVEDHIQAGDQIVQLHESCSRAIQIGDGTINLVTSEMSLCSDDKDTVLEALLSTSRAGRAHTLLEPATDVLRTSEQCSNILNATIVLNTDDPTSAVERMDMTINLITTPDSTQDPRHEDTKQATELEVPAVPAEHSVRMGLDLPSSDSAKAEEEQLLSQQVPHDAIDNECVEVHRRADMSCYRPEDHVGSEDLLHSKVENQTDLAQTEISLLRDEEMDISRSLERSSVCRDEDVQVFQKGAVEDNGQHCYDNSALNDAVSRRSLMSETLRTLNASVRTSTSESQGNYSVNYTIEESLNEASVRGRDISIMRIGGRFRSSTSTHDDSVLSLRSLRDETICLPQRMMFDSHSLQVIYVNPVEDQPEGNLIRKEIKDELMDKLHEMKETSTSEMNAVWPELLARFPERAIAAKSMDARALSLDDADLLVSGRLRAEIEWAQIRAKVADEARLRIEALIERDAELVKGLQEDVELCSSVDQLRKEVQVLEDELEGLPSAEEAQRILDSYDQAQTDEEHLDDQILDLEIEELRLMLELERRRNRELRELNAELASVATTLERNNARVRTLVRQVKNW